MDFNCLSDPLNDRQVSIDKSPPLINRPIEDSKLFDGD